MGFLRGVYGSFKGWKIALLAPGAFWVSSPAGDWILFWSLDGQSGIVALFRCT